MFSKREKDIMKLFMEHQGKFTTSQIAASLKVSSRTIKTDIKNINEELKKISCKINSQSGVGLWLECDSETRKKLEQIIYNGVESCVEPRTRKYYLAADLLFQNDYIPMENLAQKYFISKATVLNDLNELENFWKWFDIDFVKKVKYGVKVEGIEPQVRAALIEAIKKTGGMGDVGGENLQLYFQDVDLKKLVEIVHLLEKRFQFVLTDNSIKELVLVIAVMIKRMRAFHSVQFQESDLYRESRRMRFVLEFLIHQLEENMQVEFSNEEKSYLEIYLGSLRFHVPIEKEENLLVKRNRNPEMFAFMNQLLQECDKKFSTRFSEDDELIETLMVHLECMVLRINSKLQNYNPILDMIKKEMLYEYEVASYFMVKFLNKYHLDVLEDEIGFITFYFGASIERMKYKKTEQVTVAIVCMAGCGPSHFLKVKLERYFQNIKIKNILSKASVSQSKLDKEEYDLIITTIPLNIDNIPVVQVSPVLKDADIKNIQAVLVSHLESGANVQADYSYLRRFLHNEITILNCDLKSKEEVIHLLGYRMFSEGFTDSQFIESVFDRENLSATTVGSLIAIPHAFEGHVIKQGIGFMTLKKPIDWEGERVQLIFMLSLDATSNDYIKEIFGNVLDLTKDKRKIEKMLKVDNFKDLFN